MLARLVPLYLISLTLFQSTATAAPTARNDAFQTPEDLTLSLPAPGVLTNDDLDGHTNLLPVLLTQPAQGVLQLLANGGFSFYPPRDFSGPVTFTYQLANAPGSTTMTVDSTASILTSTIAVETFVTGGTTSTLTRTTRTAGSMQVRLSSHQAPFGMVQVEKLNLTGLDAMAGSLCASRLFGTCLASVSVDVPANSLRVTMNVPTDTGQALPAVAVAGNGTFSQSGNFVNTDGVVNIFSNSIASPPPASLAGTEVPQDFRNGQVSQSNGVVRVGIPLDIPATFSQSGNWDSPGEYRATVRITGMVYATAAAVPAIRTAPATVTLNVQPVDDPPVALGETLQGQEMVTQDIPASRGLLQNDTDVDGPAITAELLTQPQRGRVALQPDGSLTFTLAPRAAASAAADGFYYRLLQDGQPATTNQPILTANEHWKLYTAVLGATPTNWQTPEASDLDWSVGPAPLGYGYADVATTVDFGPDPLNKPITHYLRQSFVLPIASVLASKLHLRLRRDDGVAIWLNGVEVARNNLPGTLGDGQLNSYTTALADVDHQAGEFIDFSIPASHLKDGENLLAVEMHQFNGASPDFVFNLSANLETHVGAYVTLRAIPNDADADGMADTWEAENGLNPSVDDSSADPDKDKKSNLAEFHAGTHPQLAASQWSIQNLVKASETDLEFAFPTLAGRRYQLQTSSRLTNWTDIGPRWTTSPASTAKPTTLNAQFYRLRAIPPWGE